MFDYENTGIKDDNNEPIFEGNTVIGYPSKTEYKVIYSPEFAAFVGRHTSKNKTSDVPLFTLKLMYKNKLFKK